MSLLNKDYSFEKISKRIEEIKKKNILLREKFKISEISYDSPNNVKEPKDVKSVNYDEVFAVENCHKKALKLVENCKKLRLERKQQKIKSCLKRNSDLIELIEPKLGEERKRREPVSVSSKNFNEKCKFLSKSSYADVSKLKVSKNRHRSKSNDRTEKVKDVTKRRMDEKQIELIELDVKKKLVKQVIPEINLTEDFDKEFSIDIDVTSPEVIILETDELEKNSDTTMVELDFPGISNDFPISEVDDEESIPEVITLDPDTAEKYNNAVAPEYDFNEKLVSETHKNEDIPEVLILEPQVAKKHSETSLSDLYLMEEQEIIVPELDFTEEPVDFPVPEIHKNFKNESIHDSSEKALHQPNKSLRKNWSREEVMLLKRNMKDFQSKFGAYDARLLLGLGRRFLFSKHECMQIQKFLKAKHFYLRLGKDINDRTLHQVYDKAREVFNNTYKHFKDVTQKDITAVLSLHKKYGPRWVLIGQKLGIYHKDCCKIFLSHKKHYIKGKWSGSETNNLISALKFYIKNVSDLRVIKYQHSFWEKIAERVYTRSPLQCYCKSKSIMDLE